MMRTCLTIAGLLLLWAFIGRARAQEPVLPEKSFPRPAVGLGNTEDAAKQNAVKEAVTAVEVLMRQQIPPLKSFVPTADYVRQHLLAGGRPGREIRIDGLDHPMQEWIVAFRTDYNWWKDIVRRDREEERKIRADSHQAFAFRSILGLSGLFLAGYGYVRFNEYTRHRYTKWLRVAGVGAASVAAAALWWML